MSVLEDLYDGNINPYERYINPEGEYQRLNTQVTGKIEVLINSLSSEEKQQLDEIIDSFAAIGYISEKENFIEGFCLGAKIMLEIISFKSQNFFTP